MILIGGLYLLLQIALKNRLIFYQQQSKNSKHLWKRVFELLRDVGDFSSAHHALESPDHDFGLCFGGSCYSADNLGQNLVFFF